MATTPRLARAALTTLLTTVLALVATLLGSAHTAYAGTDLVFTQPVENYAGYQPQTGCNRKLRPGIRLLSDHLVQRGGGRGPIFRACAGSSVSEHKESRAFDWVLDATKKKDRKRARAFLDEIFAPDADGNPHALARRMGIMYIIWNDRQWSSYRGFQPRNYLPSSCKSKKKCSKTARHRDHVHISLTRRAAKGKLSWYLAQHSD
ncbi:hypothetical protein [Nocardioides jishulii]|uniref:ARB-07466-like C-terminal domain-containing protein n=1 Tax=Nocardioides jishulii TaxID=2575440 RepID=A0A4U2YSQ6_9ACTN|nr:hypothetical protein [Nocardioides jishulii]QCX28609.1 hypothetical protein FCL41_14505 [Nocardioides jishulii]TKI64498.1 hypothetical protein FC770_05070 [Nocardioides jishulii]